MYDILFLQMNSWAISHFLCSKVLSAWSSDATDANTQVRLILAGRRKLQNMEVSYNGVPIKNGDLPLVIIHL